MPLDKVTITGADDSTDIQDLLDLSAEFPFVEWGILVSAKQEGSYRFPSRIWIGDFVEAAAKNNLSVSTHICGRWVREILVGQLDWEDLPSCFDISQRVQLNTHAEPHLATAAFAKTLQDKPNKEFIFQRDGVNNSLAAIALASKIKASILFDKSGGAGILPESWPAPFAGFVHCGYAGGLGPDNVVDQIKKIEAGFLDKNTHYWIDMERRVRLEDDSALDMKKVKAVLEKVDAFMYDKAGNR